MKHYLFAAVFTLTLAGSLVAKDDESDKEFPIEKLPAKVTAEIKRVAGQVTVEEAQRKEKDGYVYFKLEAVREGHKYKFEVTDFGELLKYQLQYDKVKEELTIEQLPEAIRSAAFKAVKDIELKDAKRETRGPIVTYEIDGRADGRRFEITLSAKGKVIEVIDKDKEKARKEAEKSAELEAERKQK